MSTIVVVRKNGRVAIGADTLAKDGYTMQRAALVANHTKIVHFDDTWIAYTGSGGWGTVLPSYFRKPKHVVRFDSVETIFETITRMHSVLKSNYGLNPNNGENNQFETSRLSLLIANRHGCFGVYGDRSVTEFSTFYSFGAGYRLALGAMHVAYPRFDDAEKIARLGIEAAAEFDEDTALPAEVHGVELSASEPSIIDTVSPPLHNHRTASPVA
jgi:ATP-dependent protease HslVU (ClpYQ) peptidase subunit